MAQLPPSEEEIHMAMTVTGCDDQHLIATALQGNRNNIDVVVSEYFDLGDQGFRSKYSWDDSAFSAGRDGDAPSNIHAANPSFVIHAPDSNEVLYGSEPGGYYGPAAPSRPPSRANNKSPIGRLVDLASENFNVNAPSNKQEEDAELQRAITQSLHESGGASPHTAPLPLPQQSGITGSGTTSPYFGPANRSDYDPDQWAMVEVKRTEPDPEAPLRKRTSETPVFLRCRYKQSWKHHRVGGILVVFHAIPAARNALLRVGTEPDYGYGSRAEWWKGDAILPPDLQAVKEQTENDTFPAPVYPPWTDELRRLMAFLDSSERSYGTADILAEAVTAVEASGDHERDFFHELEFQIQDIQSPSLFSTTVEIMSLVDDLEYSGAKFALLDAPIQKADVTAMTKSIYNLLDLVFYANPSTTLDSLEAGRLAMITTPPQIFTIRLLLADGLPDRKEVPIEVPPMLYMDRYHSTWRRKIQQIQKELITVASALQKNYQQEAKLVEWNFSTSGATPVDDRSLAAAAIKRCQDQVNRIKNAGFWRDHETRVAGSEGQGQEFYLAGDHTGEPELRPQEAEVVGYYETRIRQLEQSLAKMNQVMTEIIQPERDMLNALIAHLGTLMREPTPEEGWNPVHKYTLRGVVTDMNKVFVLKREPSLMEMEDAQDPVEQWWKLSCQDVETNGNDNSLLGEITSFQDVVREGFAKGTNPILIYATETAMNETPEPLSDMLKTFVRFDNRHFKQELAVAEEELAKANSTSHYAAALNAGVMTAHGRPSSVDSMDVMAGDIDEDMRDVNFDHDDLFSDQNTYEDEHPFESKESRGGASPPLSPKGKGPLLDLSEDSSHMDRLARVSLEDNRTTPPDGREMKERVDASLLTWPTYPGAFGNGEGPSGAGR